jgi:predicted glycoside hydrolase/deacetylase ChbG (UPF0249 family)
LVTRENVEGGESSGELQPTRIASIYEVRRKEVESQPLEFWGPKTPIGKVSNESVAHERAKAPRKGFEVLHIDGHHRVEEQIGQAWWQVFEGIQGIALQGGERGVLGERRERNRRPGKSFGAQFQRVELWWDPIYRSPS